MKVVALFRVSTEKQANEGASLDAQEREYRELAARHGWTTVREFRGCESATQAASERRVLQQVLGCLREQAVDAVYVHEQSRLTRGDELEVALLMRELKERGTKIIVHGTVRDPASIDDRFMLGIQSLVDRAESERIKERLGRGKKQRALQGRKNSGPAPYGYMNPPPGDPKRGILQVVESEAVVVRRIFDMALNRRMGSQGIAVELNERGVPSSRGGRWCKTAIERILVNPVYIGTAATNVWEEVGKSGYFRLNLQNPKATIVENAHEAIITRDVWEAVQARPKRVTTRIPRMLTGLVHVNGHPYAGDSTEQGAFYRAPRGTRGLPWLAAREVDDAVWDAFASLATGPEFVEGMLRAADKPRQRELALQEVEYLSDQVGKRRRRLERLLEMRMDGELTREQYAERKAREEGELVALERDLRAQEGLAAAPDPSQAQRVVRAVQTVLAGRTRLTTDQKRGILLTVVRRVDVEAVPTGAVQGRGTGGGFASGRLARWKVGRVQLEVATGVPAYVRGDNIESDAGGSLATTFFRSGQAAGAVGGSGGVNGGGGWATVL